ncbi:MAG: hypothetical protein AB7O78_01755 [Thermoleophilia bacterium]
MTTAVATPDVLAGVEVILREKSMELTRAYGEIAALRAALGVKVDDGVMSLERIRALEDASDACRTHFLGGPVTRLEALEACERARRTQ